MATSPAGIPLAQTAQSGLSVVRSALVLLLGAPVLPFFGISLLFVLYSHQIPTATTLNFSKLEFLILSIYNNSSKLSIGLFYRPSSSPIEVLNKFCTTLECLDTSRFQNFILLGDFNIDFYNPHTAPYLKLIDTMHTLSLSQAVQEATHTTSNG